MGRKTDVQDAELTKPTFNPADFFPADEDEGETSEAMDFGDEFDPDAIPDEDEDEPESEDDAADESTEEDPAEEDAPEAEEDPAPETEEEVEEEDEGADKAEQDQPEEEPQPEEDKRRGKPNHMIPKRRLDSQIAKTRQLEEQLQQMQKENAAARKEAAEKAKVSDEQIQDWLKASAQKINEGELEEAAAFQHKAMDAMSQNRGEVVDTQQPLNPDDLVAQIEERVELKHTVKQMLVDYPMLDLDNEAFDENLNDEVLEYQDYFVSKGYTGSVAVEKAVNMLAAAHQLTPATQVVEKKPPAKPDRDTKPNIKKKVDAAARQPGDPMTRGRTKPAADDAININDLDEEQLAALPESVRARLRGDS